MKRYPEGPGYSNDTTSLAAAEVLAPKLESMRMQVLRYIASRPLGATCEEVCLGMKIFKANSIEMLRRDVASARICELHQLDLIVDTGETRIASSGRAMIVWRAATATDRVNKEIPKWWEAI